MDTTPTVERVEKILDKKKIESYNTDYDMTAFIDKSYC